MRRGKPMRLLMTADAVGGVWQYATDLANALVDHGFETVLALLGPAPTGGQRAATKGLAGVRLIETGQPLDWLSDAGSVAAATKVLRELARAEGADLVHLNSPALAAHGGFGVPVVGGAHGCLATRWAAARPGQPLDPALAWHADTMARGLRACDLVVTPSASFAQAVHRQYRLPTTPTVVHNGRAPRPASGSPALHDCAFTAGRLWDEVKNAAVLDAAAARLPFPFHAAGPIEAPHGGRVELEHLHWLGTLGEAALALRFRQRPVFVSAATFEPFGLAVLEAAQAGCALILSDIPTFRELWDGVAVFVAPDDAQTIAETIELCVQDPELRHALGEAARKRAQRYTVERMAASMAAHYAALLTPAVAAVA